jgi:7-cyano-7-deazaguanine synthase
MNGPAVVLLSGGLDSATVLAMATSEGHDCHALSFDYGQRHRVELDSAARVAAAAQVRRHIVSRIDLGSVGGSALTADIDVPKRDADGPDPVGAAAIPVTYVPARNTIFLSFALAWAEVLGASHIYLGVNAVDYSGYPDCRPEYLEAFQTMANLATRAGVEGDTPITIHAPLIDLSKPDIIRVGLDLGVDYGLTSSCYDPMDDLACGACDACVIRRRAFAEVGVPDPVAYGSVR